MSGADKNSGDTTPPGTEDGQDDDRTVLFQPRTGRTAPPGPDDDERTVIAGVQPPPGAETPIIANGQVDGDELQTPDEDATVLALNPSDGGGAGPVTHTATASVVPPRPDQPPATLNSLEPGTVINNMYRVEERLDQGGMGRVFRGTEIGTGESVAIKVILPEMAEDAKVTDMFRREARVLRELHHDAIVRYFAYIPPDQRLNLHALVMGFIKGTKLSDTLKENGALSRDQVIKLTLRLADGLARAHKIGVVHRDLSPDNVMLQDGDIAKAVLIDFGISRSSTNKDVTIGNEFAGKLKYVSPEQMGAFGGNAEGPSDIYSLGLLMIAMLDGKPMDMGGNFVEAVTKRQSVPDLSHLPADFQPLIADMLQPDPAERIPTMERVIRELRILNGETATGIGTRPPPVNRAVPGLQAVPFSGGAAPKTAAAPTAPEQKGGRGGVLGLLMATALIAAGAGVYFFTDLIPRGPSAPAGGDAVTDPVEAGLTRVPGSRATFLAEAVPEACAYASLRGAGESAGLIEGFGQDLSALQSVPGGFGAAFGSTPALVPRGISPEQCAVLDTARALQGTPGAGIELVMDSAVVSRADGINGVLTGSDGRQNWLALVAPNGQVFSLVRQLADPIGSERRLGFRMPGAAPGIYLVLATASDATLVRAGAMQDGTAASDIMPLLTRELALDGQGAVDIGFLEVTR
ncbi:MAG: serine/threonine-protein kinase [Pseudomonadota bacterium]